MKGNSGRQPLFANGCSGCMLPTSRRRREKWGTLSVVMPARRAGECANPAIVDVDQWTKIKLRTGLSNLIAK
jgi:hypothetical protein